MDRRGRPITDLDASVFTVRIDGQPRRVVEARLLSPAPTAPRARPSGTSGLDVLSTSNAPGGRDPRGRRIVIVVDRESLSFGEGRHALRGAAEFVDRLHPSDRVALYPVWNSCAHIDFTTDHRRVREAVACMGGQGDPWSLLGTVELDAAHVGISEAFAVVVGGSEGLLEIVAAAIRADKEFLRQRLHRMVQASQPAGNGRPARRPARHRSLPPRRPRELGGVVLDDGKTPCPCTGPARRVSPRSRCVRSRRA